VPVGIKFYACLYCHKGHGGNEEGDIEVSNSTGIFQITTENCLDIIIDSPGINHAGKD
jgi:hypothetical protein